MNNDLLIESLILLRQQTQGQLKRSFHSGVSLGKGGQKNGLLQDQHLTTLRNKIREVDNIIEQLRDIGKYNG